MSRLARRRTIITGAGAGIGRAGVGLFSAEGARVVAIDKDAAALETLKQETPGLDIICADLSVPANVTSAIAEAVRMMGGLDVLWSNAGMNGPSTIEAMPDGSYDSIVALNLTATVHACAAAASVMRQGTGGSIVLTASVAGIVGSIQSPVYSATKHAVVGLARSLALQFAKDGIRVNSVCPGPVRTPMLEDLRSGRIREDGPVIVDHLIGSIPLGRLAEPREIAEAALWLGSDASSFVTGIALLADGGVTAQ